MKKEFVTYEIALKLKELGFDEECLKLWEHTDFYTVLINPDAFKRVVSERYCKAPLWQQIVDWFREKYNLHIIIDYNVSKENKWYYAIFHISTNSPRVCETVFMTYEEAREQAILKCIELCQTQLNVKMRSAL